MWNGISAVHLAVFWPRGLELLFHFCPNVDLNMKCSRRAPLYFALYGSRDEACEEQSDTLCNTCPCAESVKVLLEHGCRADARFEFYSDIGSPHATYAFLSHIKSWRVRLMEIARHELCETEMSDISFCNSSVLDHSAPKVIRKLEARGIFPSQELQLDPRSIRLSPLSYGFESSSIYHVLRRVSSMEIAFRLGFRDIDVFYQSETPVMRKSLPLDCCEWFLDHGASITNLMPSAPNLAYSEKIPLWTVAHSIMSRVERYSESEDLRDRLVLKLCGLDIGDGCDCGCSDSEGGCSPLKVFLASRRRYSPPIPDDLSQFIKVIDTHASTSPTIAGTIIRACTFEALEILHTCCATVYFPPNARSDYGEDFPHIRDEDEQLLEELEHLVAGFKDHFHPEEQSLSQFMGGYWKDRMEQIKEEKAARRLSQEEIDAAANLGIMLREESPEEQVSETKPTLSDLVENYIHRLNKIYI